MPENLLDMPARGIQTKQGVINQVGQFTQRSTRVAVFEKPQPGTNIGIFDNDLIIVEKQSTAVNGDTVVALIEDSVTVKTFYRESDHIRLQPENDFMEPIRVSDTEVQIVGKVVSLFRQYI